MRISDWSSDVCSSDLFAPLLVGRHAGSDLVQFLERMDPEEFIEIEIAVATLCRAEIGAEKMQFGRRFLYRAQVRRDQHRVAGQSHADQLGEADDVRPELMRLRP